MSTGYDPRQEVVSMTKAAAEGLRNGVVTLQHALVTEVKNKEAALSMLRNQQAGIQKAAAATVDVLIDAQLLPQVQRSYWMDKLAGRSGHVEALTTLARLGAEYGSNRTVSPPVIGGADQTKAAAYGSMLGNTAVVLGGKDRSAADDEFERLMG